METNQSLPVEAPAGGFLQGLAFFLSGLVLPLGSLSFYRKAAQQRVGIAILFFFLFTSGISVLVTINAAKSMGAVQSDIQKNFDEGKIPEITIQDGIAQVKGAQTTVFSDDPQIFAAIDTTGQYQGIDRSKYQQGFLMTRDTLYILSQNGQYQGLPLSEFNTAFNMNPIVINASTSIQAWRVFMLIGLVVFFVVLILWNTFVRLMVVAFLALLVWGIASLISPKVAFTPVIASALYALVPAIYLSYLFDLANISFPGLQTLLFIPFWAAGLFASLSSAKFLQETSLRLWRALLGLPLLLLLMIDLFVEYPYRAQIAWGVAALTMLALVAVGLLTRARAAGSTPVSGVPQA